LLVCFAGFVILALKSIFRAPDIHSILSQPFFSGGLNKFFNEKNLIYFNCFAYEQLWICLEFLVYQVCKRMQKKGINRRFFFAKYLIFFLENKKRAAICWLLPGLSS